MSMIKTEKCYFLNHFYNKKIKIKGDKMELVRCERCDDLVCKTNISFVYLGSGIWLKLCDNCRKIRYDKLVEWARNKFIK